MPTNAVAIQRVAQANAQAASGAVGGAVMANGQLSTGGVANPKDAPGYVPGSSTTDRISPVTPSVTTPPPTATVPSPPPVSSTGTDALTTVQGQLATLQRQVLDATNAGYASTDTVNYDAQGNIIPKATTDATATKGFTDYFKDALSSAKDFITPPPNTADIYTADRAASGIDALQTTAKGYTDQINAVMAKANADKLSLVGQGQGTPEAIIGGKQAQIDREAAIKVLPLAALQAAAQGDVTTAQSHLDTLFKLHSEDATNAYNYQVKLIDFASNLADKQETQQLDALKTTVATNHSDKLSLISDIRNLTNTALANHDAASVKKLSDLAASLPDINSKDFTTLYDKAQTQVGQLASGIQVNATADTLEERQSSALAQFSSRFVPGVKMSNGIPTVDSDGKITPEAWQAAIKDAPLEGLTRKAFIEEFGNMILGKDNVTVSAKYGLTATEEKLITGI